MLINTILQNYFKSLEKWGNFRGSILIEQKSKIIFCHGCGPGNGENTIFQIGSLTKQFTARAIHQLKIDLNSSILDYLPEKYHSKYWKDITVNQLLEHRSGIPNYTDDPQYFKRKMTTEKIIEFSQGKALHFRPGSAFEYSNTGYLLLGLIIEAQTKMSYAFYLYENIFRPLGMENSGVYEGKAIPGRAKGYCLDKTGLYLMEDHSESIEATLSDGAVYSTVLDFNKWCHELDCSEILKSKKEYHDGFEIRDIYGRKAVGHSGSVAGYNADFCIIPEEDLHIIVFGNNLHFNATYISAKVAGYLIEGQALVEAIALPEDFYFSRRFRTGDGGRVEFYQKKGRVILEDQMCSECVLLSNGRLFNPRYGVEFEMDRNENVIVYDGYGNRMDILV